MAETFKTRVSTMQLEASAVDAAAACRGVKRKRQGSDRMLPYPVSTRVSLYIFTIYTYVRHQEEERCYHMPPACREIKYQKIMNRNRQYMPG